MCNSHRCRHTINQIKELKKKHKVCLIGIGGEDSCTLSFNKKKPKIFVIEKKIKKNKNFSKNLILALLIIKKLKVSKFF